MTRNNTILPVKVNNANSEHNLNIYRLPPIHFMISVSDAFKIEFDKNTDVYLCDQTNARIPPELFGTIL